MDLYLYVLHKVGTDRPQKIFRPRGQSPRLYPRICYWCGDRRGRPPTDQGALTRRDIKRCKSETVDYRRRLFSGIRGGAPTANALCIQDQKLALFTTTDEILNSKNNPIISLV
jgi:hypothetical protein